MIFFNIINMKMNFYLIGLIISSIVILWLLLFLRKNRKKKQLTEAFFFSLFCLLICCIGLIAQILLSNKLNIEPIYFDYFVYVGTCFLPIGLLLIGYIFYTTKMDFTKWLSLLLVVPIFSLLILWTNDYHHLFYNVYDIHLENVIVGPYTYIHTLYSYTIIVIGLYFLVKGSIKSSGFFSVQSFLIIVGSLFPLVINILGTLRILPMTIYSTPISFTIFCFFAAIAIFKFQFLSVAPIALQRIVNRMSDLYVVINDNFKVVEFNKPFLDMTHMTSSTLRNKDIFNLLVDSSDLFDSKTDLENAFSTVMENPSKLITLEKYSESLDKYLNIEISSIYSNNNFLGILILFKDTTQHMLDLQTIKNSQDILVERERLASLGQMIGGIAHNLKTPIMSISGAAEGLSDLIKEYDSSIGDKDVTDQDHHEIAHDMDVWVEKIRDYTGYMSDVITAVKGQAVNLSDEEAFSFTLEELVKRINILMKHELKNAICYLNTSIETDPSTELNGNINSLVQVINNMISNAIQSYNGVPEKNIDMVLYKQNNNIIISIKDYGSGLPKKVKEKLFKEMITTKGKNGTGLGLFMSYSNIRAHFNGNITFESEEGKGTTFFIELPIK